MIVITDDYAGSFDFILTVKKTFRREDGVMVYFLEPWGIADFSWANNDNGVGK
jgi:hypothetical protein